MGQPYALKNVARSWNWPNSQPAGNHSWWQGFTANCQCSDYFRRIFNIATNLLYDMVPLGSIYVCCWYVTNVTLPHPATLLPPSPSLPLATQHVSFLGGPTLPFLLWQRACAKGVHGFSMGCSREFLGLPNPRPPQPAPTDQWINGHVESIYN